MNDDPWSLIRGLFPKWDPTIEEATLFRKAFKSRRSDLLIGAIEDYRTFYKYREPNLGGILSKYADRFREANRSLPASEAPEPDEAEERRAFEASKRRIAHDLDLMSEDDLTQVTTEIGKMSSLQSFVGRLGSDRDKWGHIQRGLVWAKAMEMGIIAGSSPSPAPQSPSLGHG